MILLTGITGMVGSNLVKNNKEEVKIKGLYFGDYEMQDTKSTSYIKCDILDKEKLFKMVSND